MARQSEARTRQGTRPRLTNWSADARSSTRRFKFDTYATALFYASLDCLSGGANQEQKRTRLACAPRSSPHYLQRPILDRGLCVPLRPAECCACLHRPRPRSTARCPPKALLSRHKCISLSAWRRRESNPRNEPTLARAQRAHASEAAHITAVATRI